MYPYDDPYSSPYMPRRGAGVPPAQPAFDAETLKAMQELGISTERIDQLRQKYDRAEDMRFNQPMPQMRGGGAIQTAANPLEFIGRGIQQYRGGRAMQQANQDIMAEAAKMEQQRGQIRNQFNGGPGGGMGSQEDLYSRMLRGQNYRGGA